MIKLRNHYTQKRRFQLVYDLLPTYVKEISHYSIAIGFIFSVMTDPTKEQKPTIVIGIHTPLINLELWITHKQDVGKI
jgi:hypothetical protein